MNYDFDKPVNRRGTLSVKWDVAGNELPMWVADMDFETAPEIQDAIQKRAGHGAFGYTLIPDEWYESIQNWSETYDSGGESRASDTGLQHFFQFGCK